MNDASSDSRKADEGRNFIWSTKPPQRMSADERLSELHGEIGQQRSFDVSGPDAVDAKSQRSALGGGVRRGEGSWDCIF